MPSTISSSSLSPSHSTSALTFHLLRAPSDPPHPGSPSNPNSLSKIEIASRFWIGKDSKEDEEEEEEEKNEDGGGGGGSGGRSSSSNNNTKEWKYYCPKKGWFLAEWLVEWMVKSKGIAGGSIKGKQQQVDGPSKDAKGKGKETATAGIRSLPPYLSPSHHHLLASLLHSSTLSSTSSSSSSSTPPSSSTPQPSTSSPSSSSSSSSFSSSSSSSNSSNSQSQSFHPSLTTQQISQPTLTRQDLQNLASKFPIVVGVWVKTIDGISEQLRRRRREKEEQIPRQEDQQQQEETLIESQQQQSQQQPLSLLLLSCVLEELRIFLPVVWCLGNDDDDEDNDEGDLFDVGGERGGGGIGSSGGMATTLDQAMELFRSIVNMTEVLMKVFETTKLKLSSKDSNQDQNQNHHHHHYHHQLLLIWSQILDLVCSKINIVLKDTVFGSSSSSGSGSKGGGGGGGGGGGLSKKALNHHLLYSFPLMIKVFYQIKGFEHIISESIVGIFKKFEKSLEITSDMILFGDREIVRRMITRSNNNNSQGSGGGDGKTKGKGKGKDLKAKTKTKGGGVGWNDVLERCEDLMGDDDDDGDGDGEDEEEGMEEGRVIRSAVLLHLPHLLESFITHLNQHSSKLFSSKTIISPEDEDEDEFENGNENKEEKVNERTDEENKDQDDEKKVNGKKSNKEKGTNKSRRQEKSKSKSKSKSTLSSSSQPQSQFLLLSSADKRRKASMDFLIRIDGLFSLFSTPPTSTSTPIAIVSQEGLITMVSEIRLKCLEVIDKEGMYSSRLGFGTGTGTGTAATATAWGWRVVLGDWVNWEMNVLKVILGKNQESKKIHSSTVSPITTTTTVDKKGDGSPTTMTSARMVALCLDGMAMLTKLDYELVRERIEEVFELLIRLTPYCDLHHHFPPNSITTTTTTTASIPSSSYSSSSPDKASLKFLNSVTDYHLSIRTLPDLVEKITLALSSFDYFLSSSSSSLLPFQPLSRLLFLDRQFLDSLKNGLRVSLPSGGLQNGEMLKTSMVHLKKSVQAVSNSVNNKDGNDKSAAKKQRDLSLLLQVRALSHFISTTVIRAFPDGDEDDRKEFETIWKGEWEGWVKDIIEGWLGGLDSECEKKKDGKGKERRKEIEATIEEGVISAMIEIWFEVEKRLGSWQHLGRQKKDMGTLRNGLGTEEQDRMEVDEHRNGNEDVPPAQETRVVVERLIHWFTSRTTKDRQRNGITTLVEIDVARLLLLFSSQYRITSSLCSTFLSSLLEQTESLLVPTWIPGTVNSSVSRKGWTGSLFELDQNTLPIAIWDLITDQGLDVFEFQPAEADLTAFTQLSSKLAELIVIISARTLFTSFVPVTKVANNKNDEIRGVTADACAMKLLKRADTFEMPRLRKAIMAALIDHLHPSKCWLSSNSSPPLIGIFLFALSLPNDYIDRATRKQLIQRAVEIDGQVGSEGEDPEMTTRLRLVIRKFLLICGKEDSVLVRNPGLLSDMINIMELKDSKALVEDLEAVTIALYQQTIRTILQNLQPSPGRPSPVIELFQGLISNGKGATIKHPLTWSSESGNSEDMMSKLRRKMFISLLELVPQEVKSSLPSDAVDFLRSISNECDQILSTAFKHVIPDLETSPKRLSQYTELLQATRSAWAFRVSLGLSSTFSAFTDFCLAVSAKLLENENEPPQQPFEAVLASLQLFNFKISLHRSFALDAQKERQAEKGSKGLGINTAPVVGLTACYIQLQARRPEPRTLTAFADAIEGITIPELEAIVDSLCGYVVEKAVSTQSSPETLKSVCEIGTVMLLNSPPHSGRIMLRLISTFLSTFSTLIEMSCVPAANPHVNRDTKLGYTRTPLCSTSPLGQDEQALRVLVAMCRFLEVICAEKAALLQRPDAIGIFSTIKVLLQPGFIPFPPTATSNRDSVIDSSRQICRSITHSLSLLVRHRKDHIIPLFTLVMQVIPALLATLRIPLRHREIREEDTKVDQVNDSTLQEFDSVANFGRSDFQTRTCFPFWAWPNIKGIKAPVLGVEEARGVGRLLSSFAIKTPTPTFSLSSKSRPSSSQPTSLSGPVSKHGPFLLLTYLRFCASDPRFTIPTRFRRELAGGWYEVMSMMGSHEREALMKGFLREDDDAEREILRTLWKGWEKEKYKG